MLQRAADWMSGAPADDAHVSSGAAAAAAPPAAALGRSDMPDRVPLLRSSSGSLWQREEATYYGESHNWDSSQDHPAASLLAPTVDSIDAEALDALRCVNRPLTTLGSDGVFYVRGVKYTITPGSDITGMRSAIWMAERDPSAPCHDVRSSLVRGSTVDRVCPSHNEKKVCVKIVRCTSTRDDELQRCEEAMSTGVGNPIFSAAGPAEARREAQMHARAQHFTAVTGSAGVVGLLAVSGVGVRCHRKWLKNKLAKSVKVDPEGFPLSDSGSSEWIIYVCVALPVQSTLGEMIKRERETKKPIIFHQIPEEEDSGSPRPRSLSRQYSRGDLLVEPRDERCVKWIIKALLQQIGQLHKHGIVHLDISLGSVTVDDDGAVRLVSFKSSRPVQDPPRDARDPPRVTWPRHISGPADLKSGLPHDLEQARVRIDEAMQASSGGGAGAAMEVAGVSATTTVPRRVGWIGSSTFQEFKDPEEGAKDAKAIGAMVARKGWTLVTGGEFGWGPHETAADALYAAKSEAGAGGAASTSEAFHLGHLPRDLVETKDDEELREILRKRTTLYRQECKCRGNIGLHQRLVDVLGFEVGDDEDGWTHGGEGTADTKMPQLDDATREQMLEWFDIKSGITVLAGSSYHERRALLGSICPVYIVFGGGPGTINEVMHALAQGAIVIRFPRTGGAASGMFQIPPCPLPDRSDKCRVAFETLLRGGPESDRGEQIACIERLVESAFVALDAKEKAADDAAAAEAVEDDHRAAAAAAQPELALAVAAPAPALVEAAAGILEQQQLQQDVRGLGLVMLSLLRKDAGKSDQVNRQMMTNSERLALEPNWYEDDWPGWKENGVGRPSAEAIDLLYRMLDNTESTPYTIEECLEHPWFIQSGLPPPFVVEAAMKARGVEERFAYRERLEFRKTEHCRLLAPPIATIDCEAKRYTETNAPLTELKADGVIYIRGVKYTLVSYLGGGAFGKVWKAKREVEGFPYHDVVDKHDTLAPILNKDYIAVKICESKNGPLKRGGKSKECAGIDLRREIQITARASHYVPGVLQLLAASPMKTHMFHEGTIRAKAGLQGTVRLVDMKWGVAPVGRWERPVGKPDSYTREMEMREKPEDCWTLMACELANDDQLSSWLKRADEKGHGQMTGHIRNIAPTTGHIRNTLIMEEGTVVHRRIARSVMARLLLHLKEQHAHGIVHFDLKPDNICVHKSDRSYKIKLLDFGLARALADQPWSGPHAQPGGTNGYKDPARNDLCVKRRGSPPVALATACDVYAAGSIMYDLLTGTQGALAQVGDVGISLGIAGTPIARMHNLIRTVIRKTCFAGHVWWTPPKTYSSVVTKFTTPRGEDEPRHDRDLGPTMKTSVETSAAGRKSALFTIYNSGSGVYQFVIDQEGSNYAAGDTIVIKGDELDGATPANDCTLTVTAAGHAGSLSSANVAVSGTPIDGSCFPWIDGDDAADLLCKMLDTNPATRITVQDALKHPFFEDEITSRGLRGSLSEETFYADVEKCRTKRDSTLPWRQHASI